MNRPEVYNANNKKCREELLVLFEEVSYDEAPRRKRMGYLKNDNKGVRVLIIKGNERFFCAGADNN
jgi:enoyl-CoA hydratase/carnithine racemase